MTDLALLARRVQQSAPAVDYWSARLVFRQSDYLGVRNDIVENRQSSEDLGVFISIINADGFGYAATSELTEAGLRRCFKQATDWAEKTCGKLLFPTHQIPRPSRSGRYRTPQIKPWASSQWPGVMQLLMDSCQSMKVSDSVVERSLDFSAEQVEQLLICSHGAEIHQEFSWVMPSAQAVANRGAITQIRSNASGPIARQGGIEVLEQVDFNEASQHLAEEAVQLLDAPQCPEERLSVLLYPDQMFLQLHESIGHPLELDRILGDERNYAGGSFVTSDMFGSYQYGSELLNVTFDPNVPGELASYAFDDDGMPAEKAYLIRDGILEQPLGGALSQTRTGLSGVSNSRACSWNRPTIDRMSNINIEPGDQSFDDLVSQMEDGVIMRSNQSWSIDDQRNKFQFGCEMGWRVKQGEIQHLIRNPNYRGVSADFWRNLVAVGDANTWQAAGVLNCGKGEPNQSIYVGHAAPACLFRDIDVFGGAA